MDKNTSETPPYLAGVIGHPISHSKSPKLHNYWLSKYDINGFYIPFSITTDKLQDSIKSLIALGFNGVNVTIPHKTNVLKYCDHLENEAIDTQSVNWIKIENEKLIGTNFDGIGFVNGLKNKNLIVENKDFAIFGIGGAGTSICYSLIRAKARRLKLINRDANKLNLLVNKFKNLKSNTEILIDDFRDYDISEYDYVINATSLGLKDNKDLIFDVKIFYIVNYIFHIIFTNE